VQLEGLLSSKFQQCTFSMIGTLMLPVKGLFDAGKMTCVLTGNCHDGEINLFCIA